MLLCRLHSPCTPHVPGEGWTCFFLGHRSQVPRLLPWFGAVLPLERQGPCHHSGPLTGLPVLHRVRMCNRTLWHSTLVGKKCRALASFPATAPVAYWLLLQFAQVAHPQHPKLLLPGLLGRLCLRLRWLTAEGGGRGSWASSSAGSSKSSTLSDSVWQLQSAETRTAPPVSGGRGVQGNGANTLEKQQQEGSRRKKKHTCRAMEVRSYLLAHERGRQEEDAVSVGLD